MFRGCRCRGLHLGAPPCLTLELIICSRTPSSLLGNLCTACALRTTFRPGRSSRDQIFFC